jgi:hypothetical protein
MKDLILDEIPEFQLLKTRKQRDFIRLYLKNDRNALKSAKEAGYSEKSAHVNAYRMLATDSIKAIIKQVDKISIEECRLTEEDVTKFWSEVLKSDKYNISDRIRVSELVAKYRKMFDNNDLGQGNIFNIFTNSDLSKLGVTDNKRVIINNKDLQVIDSK